MAEYLQKEKMIAVKSDVSAGQESLKMLMCEVDGEALLVDLPIVLF